MRNDYEFLKFSLRIIDISDDIYLQKSKLIG